MDRIAIIITTFNRDKLLGDTINNIKKNMPNDSIILIGDQNPTKEKLLQYEDENMFYYELPFDCGLAYSRNFLVKEAYEFSCPYVLMMADSIQFNQKYDFTPYIIFLEKEEKKGTVGYELNGSKCCWEFWLDILPNGIKLNSSNIFVEENNIKYKKVNICRNIFLAKTESILNLWDNDMKLCEHELAFLEYKKRGYEVYWTDSISFSKVKEENNTTYDISRKRFAEYRELLKKKLNISGWVIYSPEAMKEIRTYKLNHEEKR
jgi:glycosyltransferase involved in cell wall biosynthesis